MPGALPPLPNMPSWLDVQLKKAQGQLHRLFINVSQPVVTGPLTVGKF
jgi:hypothetical protein